MSKGLKKCGWKSAVGLKQYSVARPQRFHSLFKPVQVWLKDLWTTKVFFDTFPVTEQRIKWSAVGKPNARICCLIVVLACLCVCVCLWWFLSVSLSLAEDYSEGPLAWAVVGITAYALHSPTNPLLGCLLSQIQTEDLTQDLTAALTLCLSASHCDLSADLLLGSLHKSSLKTNGFLTAGAKHMLVCTHTADKHERCMCWLYIRFPSECFIMTGLFLWLHFIWH